MSGVYVWPCCACRARSLVAIRPSPLIPSPMEFVDIRLAEHFALRSELSIAELGRALQNGFGLPEFVYGSETETEWGAVLHDGLEYNVSRPYEARTLQHWDRSVPLECNIGVVLSVAN